MVIGSLFIGSLFISPAQAQQPPPDRRFGAVEAFWDSAAAAEAGVGWERILFYWSELQPNSADDWNGYHVQNVWLQQAAAQGREVVGLLKHTPTWATDGLLGCGVPRGLDLPLDDPGNLWATLVRRVVGMYAGQIDHWIIWNEPDIAPETYGAEWCGSVEQYYQLVKVAYLAAHEANPNAVIHLGALTYWHDRTYLRRFLAVVTQDPTAPDHNYYFDVVSVHIYFQTETVPFVINEARAALSAQGLDKPIWVNETNASPDSDPQWPLVRPCWQVSLEDQAAFLLQSFALALSAGAERIAVYKWLDAGLPPGGEPFGVLRPDGSRRPAFDAYRLLATHYAGVTSAQEERRSLYTVVTLDRGSRVTRVLWARTASNATVTLSAIATQARLIDQTGVEQVIQPANGLYTLSLPGARCPQEHAECTSPHPACIIGGKTYLLVEETGSPPPSTDTATPPPTPESPTATVAGPTETPTPFSTATPMPTDTPTEAPPPTLTPTETGVQLNTPPPPTDTPSPAATWPPAATPSTGVQLNTPPLPPPTPPAPEEPIWPMLVGLAVVMLFAVFIGTLFKHQGW